MWYEPFFLCVPRSLHKSLHRHTYTSSLSSILTYSKPRLLYLRQSLYQSMFLVLPIPLWSFADSADQFGLLVLPLYLSSLLINACVGGLCSFHSNAPRYGEHQSPIPR